MAKWTVPSVLLVLFLLCALPDQGKKTLGLRGSWSRQRHFRSVPLAARIPARFPGFLDRRVCVLDERFADHREEEAIGWFGV